MGRFVKAFDYVFIVRPVLFYPIWTVFLAGFICARKTNEIFSNHWSNLQSDLTTLSFVVTFISLSFLMSAVFIINQFTDVHSDKENNKLFLIANGLVSKKIAFSEIFVLLVLAFSLSIFLNLKLTLLLFFLFLATGVMYSLPPLFFKDRPFSGLFVNLLGGFLTFLIGWNVTTSFNQSTVLDALPYVFAIGAVYFLTTIPDLKGDQNSNKITFAVKFGPSKTIYTGILFEILCIITSIWQRDWLILIPALLSFFFFSRLLWTQKISQITQATRIPILLLSLAVCFFVPFYLLLLIGIFVLSRWYYLNRFQLHYPSLSPIQEEA